jgi:uncharacterized protein
MRTCIGCRQRVAQSDLLRIVARGSDLVPDGSVRQSGRGAYVHRTPECLKLAQRRRAFTRALRVQGPMSDTAVVAVMQQKPTTVQGSGERDERPMTSSP